MEKTFLINTVTAWDEPPRARHQLTYSLSCNHRVIFITRNKTGFPGIKTFQPQKNITVIEPVFPLDYRYRYRLPIVNEIYQEWLFRWINKNISFDHCINFDFTAMRLYSYFKDAMYYCNDEFIGIGKYPFWLINKYHKICENTVINKSSFCVVTASLLKEKLKKINHNTFLIPLGGPALGDIKVVPRKVAQTGLIHVTLIYVGTRNLDHDLINDLLLKENILIECVGPRDEEFENKILKHKNISFTGVLKGMDLFQAINKADVGIAPYVLNKLSIGVTPNKLWNYLALGKPVVISDLPNLKLIDYPDKFVYKYKSRTDFYDLIVKAHEENNDSLIEKRLKFADSNSWDKRVEEFLIIAKDFFK